MCLHTILVHPTDPQRLLIAVSAAGVYRSDDGGETWSASNRGIVVPFMPDAPAPEFGQCVHKVARDADPDASTSSTTEGSIPVTTAVTPGSR